MLFAIGIVIGLAMGLTGAGGTVMAVPLLMLLVGLHQAPAAGMALAAAALSALLGVLLRLGRGEVAWVPALTLSAVGVVLAPVGQWLAHQLPETVVLVSFTLLVVVVSARLWHTAKHSLPEDVRAHPGAAIGSMAAEGTGSGAGTIAVTGAARWPLNRLAIVGGIVGLLSGLYGVGGGFVIVPSLVLLTGMSMRRAVATSLVIIVLVSSSGFASFLVTTQIAFDITALLVVGACVGMLAGTGLSRLLAGARLQQLLAVALMALASLSLLRAF